MKKENLVFSIYIESHNDTGEKQKTHVGIFPTRWDVIKIAESLGINLNYNSPYQMRKEKMYLIEQQFRYAIREKHFITLGEFYHNPLLCIKRL